MEEASGNGSVCTAVVIHALRSQNKPAMLHGVGGSGKRILARHLCTRQVSPSGASACASGNRESHTGLLRDVVGEVLARSPGAVPGRCHTS